MLGQWSVLASGFKTTGCFHAAGLSQQLPASNVCHGRVVRLLVIILYCCFGSSKSSVVSVLFILYDLYDSAGCSPTVATGWYPPFLIITNNYHVILISLLLVLLYDIVGWFRRCWLLSPVALWLCLLVPYDLRMMTIVGDSPPTEASWTSCARPPWRATPRACSSMKRCAVPWCYPVPWRAGWDQMEVRWVRYG